MFALTDALEVVVHEVNIEACLEHSRENLSPAVEIIKVESVYPVEDVEEPVKSESGNVMRGDVFDEADLVEHDYLRDECDRLQPQTVAPYELPGGPPRVNDQCKYESGREQHLQVREIVAKGIVSLKGISHVSKSTGNKVL